MKTRYGKSFQLLNKPGIFILLMLLSLLSVETSSAEKSDWPIRFSTDEEEIAVYQPQLESYDKRNRRVVARSAFSVKASGVALKFGAMRYQGRVDKGTEKGMVRFSEIDIVELKYPGASNRRLQELETRILGGIESSRFALEAERFDASVTELEGEAGFDNSPPKIYYEESPAVLIFIDGEPVLKAVDGGNFKYVVNTAYFIVLNPEDNYFYLKGGKWWYRAKKIRGAWKPVNTVPLKIDKLAKEAFKNQVDESDTNLNTLNSPPKIIVSTTPAELILLNGEPNLAPVEGTGLLYVENTENDVLMDIESQRYYVLLSGRWYCSKSLDGDRWKYVSADDLPEGFAQISNSSTMSSVLTSVPGTDAANNALLNNAIPEVAAVDRKSATMQVTYDGDPSFVRIKGTAVYYAGNADKTVLKIRDRYFAVDEGVWFEAPTPHGTWQVAVAVPDEVNAIPPNAPVYHVKYVYVYDYTPDVVYVGYTPGYYCSYVYHGTVIYGTGFYYRPWIRRYYFSRPVTFGFGVHFHPFVGWWGFPVGVSYGWISFAWFPFPFAYFGPAGYLYGYRHGYYHSAAHGYYHGYRNGYRDGYSAGRSAGHRATFRHSRYNNHASANLYHHRSGVIDKSVPRITRARTIPTPKYSAFLTGSKTPGSATRRFRADTQSRKERIAPSTKPSTRRPVELRHRKKDDRWHRSYSPMPTRVFDHRTVVPKKVTKPRTLPDSKHRPKTTQKTYRAPHRTTKTIQPKQINPPRSVRKPTMQIKKQRQPQKPNIRRSTQSRPSATHRIKSQPPKRTFIRRSASGRRHKSKDKD
jgi:hypothetical protein